VWNYFRNKTINPRSKSWVRFDSTFPYGACKINRSTFSFAGPIEDGSNLCYTHNGCACNEVIALLHRHQVSTPPCVADTDDLKRHFKVFYDQIGRNSIYLHTREDVVNKYEGRWKRRYEQARISLQERSLTDRDFIIAMFVKDDKETTTPEKAPRAIQYRNPRAGLEMGRFTHAIESRIYNCKDEYGTRIFGKGCNMHDLADDFIKKSQLFKDPVFLELDASKFDAHVNVELLELTREFYVSMCASASEARYVKYMWGKTRVNYGRTKRNVKFKTYGTRMSGDMDTGLGNSLLMYWLIREYLRVNGIVKYAMSVNGDDSVIVISIADLGKAQNISIFKEYGFNMKFGVSMGLQEFEYCHCKMVETDYGWVMSRDPSRLISRTGWSNHKRSGRAAKDYLYSLAMGELAVNYGLPIGYAYGQKLLAYSGKAQQVVMSRKKRLYLEKQRFWKNFDTAKISERTRNSYYVTWGILPEDQIRIENQIKISFNKYVHHLHVEKYFELINIPYHFG